MTQTQHSEIDRSNLDETKPNVSSISHSEAEDSDFSRNKDADNDDDHKLDSNRVVEQPNPDSGNPPDSFWVAEDEELDWFNHNAFMQRKGSLKVILSRKLDHSSQRSVSLNHKPKTSIIGLPKHAKTGGDGRQNQRVGNNGKLMFRSRSVPGENRVGHGSEPGSPHVSCMGKVRSRRNKNGKSRFWAVLKSAFVNRKEEEPVRVDIN
ncbi:uncharacterized protein LOC141678780 [Apium graveolens]|uniref:uncharacterized protein LOC141678780 n=1 Tax=Apium graveolens TaxID=4045 RepID=UPI003D79E466